MLFLKVSMQRVHISGYYEVTRKEIGSHLKKLNKKKDMIILDNRQSCSKGEKGMGYSTCLPTGVQIPPNTLGTEWSP